MGSGGLAQLGEHLLCKQGVVGSIPSSSTRNLRGGGEWVDNGSSVKSVLGDQDAAD